MKREERKDDGSIWSSYSDMFTTVAVVFLVMFVFAMIKVGVKSLQQAQQKKKHEEQMQGMVTKEQKIKEMKAKNKIEQSINEVTDYKNVINQKMVELSKFVEKLEQNKKVMQDMVKDQIKKESIVEKVGQQLDKEKYKSSKISRENTKLKKEINEKAEELKKRLEEIRKNKNDLKSKESQLDKLSKMMERQKKEEKDLEKKIKKIIEEMKQKSKENEKLSKNLEKTKEEVKKKNEEEARIKQLLEFKEKSLVDLENKIKDRDSMLAKAKNKENILFSRVGELDKKKKEVEDEKKKIEEMLASAKKVKTQQEKKLKELNTKVTKQAKDIKQIEVVKTKLESKLKQEQEKVQEQEAENKLVNNEIVKVRSKLANTLQKVTEDTKKIQELQQVKRKNEEIIAKANREIKGRIIAQEKLEQEIVQQKKAQEQQVQKLNQDHTLKVDNLNKKYANIISTKEHEIKTLNSEHQSKVADITKTFEKQKQQQKAGFEKQVANLNRKYQAELDTKEKQLAGSKRKTHKRQLLVLTLIIKRKSLI